MIIRDECTCSDDGLKVAPDKLTVLRLGEGLLFGREQIWASAKDGVHLMLEFAEVGLCQHLGEEAGVGNECLATCCCCLHIMRKYGHQIGHVLKSGNCWDLREESALAMANESNSREQRDS